ncbi:hypothetical protein LIER_09518 [Lithospermum erythrorhizon]|uniref:Uncharacterized protein n=1 Tax=Lithospermum erythrorhizon TaxID=34254 RepID=A0AAV3PHL4_LITER
MKISPDNDGDNKMETLYDPSLKKRRIPLPFEAGPSDWSLFGLDDTDGGPRCSLERMEIELSTILDHADEETEFVGPGGESFWKHRAKMKALSDGDKNSKFFHSVVINRIKTNSILELLEENNNLLTYEESLKTHCRSRFQHIFNHKNSSPDNFPDEHSSPNQYSSIQYISSSLTQDQIDFLTLPFTPEEVKTALFQMASQKSPGPDGFPTEFHQDN